MPRSLARQLLIGGTLAVVINVAINAWIGHAMYAHRAGAPSTGVPSIANDRTAGGFLIAFFPVRVVARAPRREIRSGRVRGGGRLALPGWFERRPFVTAIVAGLLSAIVVGGG